MPFEVKPSDQVVIDWSDAGHDDALRIVTSEPPTTYFCKIHEEGSHKRLGLIPGAITADITESARRAARELFQSLGSLSQKVLDEVEEWLAKQPDAEDGLLQVVTERLLLHATARGGETVHDRLNIGTPLVISFLSVDGLPFRTAGRLEKHGRWIAEATITQISPARRFQAIMWAAARY